MATDLSAVYDALRQADAAGNTADAKQLAAYIQAQGTQSTPADSPQPSFLSRLGSTVAAPFEAAASLATGALAPAGAAVENLVTGHTSPQDYAAARAKWQYTPTNPAALMDINAVTALPRKVLGPAMNWASNKIASTGLMSPLEASDTLNTASMALPGLLRDIPMPSAARSITPEAQEATDAGLRLTPTQAGAGPVSQALEGLAGSAKLERVLSRKNAPVVDAAAAEGAGLPSLDPSDIARTKAAANAVYDRAASSGAIALKPADFDAVKATGTLKDPGVEALREHYGQMGSISAPDLLADMRLLRAQAPKNIAAPFSPAQNALGWAQRKAADALEGALQRHLDSLGSEAPVSLGEFRDARTQLAKIHSIEDSLQPNGSVSAGDLARQLDRGVPLSGNLKTIARAHQNFSRSLQDASRIRNSAPVDFGDLLNGHLVSLGARAAGGKGLLAHLAGVPALMARPALRGLLASDPYQALLAGRPLLSQGTKGLLEGFAAVAPALNQEPQGLLAR